MWCGAGDPGPGVGALAQDARNDVWFNTMSLLFPWLGEKFTLWWLDPLGGMILSIYIIIEWLKVSLSAPFDLACLGPTN